MTPRKICITNADKRRLEELIEVAGEFGNRARKDLEALAHELARADIVNPEEVRPDVVTMNSRVVLKDVQTGEEMNYVLVFPKAANLDANAISVLAPIGTAILGYSKGDIIEWPVPAGMRRIRIEKILYQPEAVGDFHL
ncbi:MAG TPA: nucleoside diphosphate kinase regulator [Kiritimatiellia bacterium]|nr:nucleoside diphosphate kinase regulator [Kiritimatiellia bacterium]